MSMHPHDQSENICGYCLRKIGLTHKFVNCALCRSKIHIKCNNIERIAYNKMDKDKEVSMCIKCNKANFPFSDDKGKEFETYNREFLASDTIRMFFKGINEFNNQQLNDNDEDFDI